MTQVFAEKRDLISCETEPNWPQNGGVGRIHGWEQEEEGKYLCITNIEA